MNKEYELPTAPDAGCSRCGEPVVNLRDHFPDCKVAEAKVAVSDGDLRLFMTAGALGLELIRAWIAVKDPAVIAGRASMYRCFQLGYLAGRAADRKSDQSL